MDANTVLAFVAFARLWEIDCFALEEQSWLLYEYDTGMLFILKDAAPSKCFLPDGFKV